MDIDTLIRDALSEVVTPGNIWALSLPQEPQPAEWITYNFETSQPEEFGDDADLEWVYYIQVHWFKQGDGARPVRFADTRWKIRKALRDAGFTVQEIVPLFEDETGLTHLVFYCYIIEDEPYGGEEFPAEGKSL